MNISKRVLLSIIVVLLSSGAWAQTYIQSTVTNSGTGIINHPGSIDLGGWVKTRANAFFYSNQVGKTNNRLTFNLDNGERAVIHYFSEDNSGNLPIKIGGVHNNSIGLTITEEGKVGINTYTPENYLHVVGGAKFRRYSGGVNFLEIDSDGSGSYITSGDPAQNQKNLYIRVAPTGLNALDRHLFLQTGMSDGSFQTRLMVHGNGNVGIGNTNPLYKLDVTGNTRVTGTLTAEGNILRSATAKFLYIPEQTNAPEFKSVAQVKIGPYLTLGNYGKGNASWIGNNATLTYSAYDSPNGDFSNKFTGQHSPGTGLVMDMNYSSGDLTGKHYNWTNTTDEVNLDDFILSWKLGKSSNYFASKVSIGDMYNEGSHMLYVKGSILTEEVQVKLRAQWPDFVFEEDYKLLSLKETEIYIKKNKHLPGVPDAQQVDEEGIKIGEMNAILLQKIEELTLHLIEQQKEIELLKQKINEK